MFKCSNGLKLDTDPIHTTAEVAPVHVLAWEDPRPATVNQEVLLTLQETSAVSSTEKQKK